MQEELKSLRQRLENAAKYLHLDELTGRKEELVEQTIAPNFWDDSMAARVVTRELASVTDTLDLYKKLETSLSDAEVLFSLLDEAGNDSDSVAEEAELQTNIENLTTDLDELEVRSLLSGEYDEKDALCRIQSGAGGTDAQDWASMLLEIYERWAKSFKYEWELLAVQNVEGGIASAEFIIRGSFVYGHLQGEHGVHRLVRISPFGKDAKRETSFASMNVLPLLEDVKDSIQINEKDIRIDTYRSSGAGGQHVNVTDSAVRITHTPTGVVASCQAERSQLLNKEKALEILTSRLLALQHQENQEKINQIRGKETGVDFGSQIRSYVLHPYQMVRDERTGFESGRIDDILAGKIDPFIQSYLRWIREN